ncbi:uncharacterized protein LOC119642952 [Glossina fuscipes]|uniref:Uncharacterized protein LOC119642952 n=1 Tax=Glossina fuscipes TaxID=7396 RepID=A0A9C5ZNG1_9MUSC|nr:uncharacterized protein LOC119642952 [Glossina fuscipes]
MLIASGEVFGMDHFINTTEWMVSYDDGGINFDGTGKVLWDINDDRVMMDADLKKFFRGSGTQTPISVRILDLCKEMKHTHSYVYEKKYRHYPFTAKGEGQTLVNMEGRYKSTVVFRAYDEHNRLRPEVISLQVPGDVIKV